MLTQRITRFKCSVSAHFSFCSLIAQLILRASYLRGAERLDEDTDKRGDSDWVQNIDWYAVLVPI